MHKLFCITLLFLTVGLACAFPSAQLRSFFGVSKLSVHGSNTSICSNTSTAESYLNLTLKVISACQSNSSCDTVLERQWSNFTTFLQNTTNQALATSNCTDFLTKLKAAKLADDIAEDVRQQISADLQGQFQQAARNVTGARGAFIEVDLNNIFNSWL